jgi:hypothetical protein
MNHDEVERRLHDTALRPQDEMFTRRVLAALPARFPPGIKVGVLRGFAAATRFGLVLLLFAAAQRWYQSGAHDAETLAVITTFVALVFAATSRLCGPLIPPSVQRILWRGR